MSFVKAVQAHTGLTDDPVNTSHGTQSSIHSLT